MVMVAKDTAQQVIDCLRKDVTPAQVSDVPQGVVDRINKVLVEQDVHAEAMLGGSFAKGTFLEGDHDIDVFVRFAASYPDKKLADLLEQVLAFAHPKRIHGSRDYFQFDLDGFAFEVVPVLRVDQAADARNVTDVSPLHVAHVRAAIAAKPLLAADIRLAKRFCKSAKVYGAESYVNGFSGHVLDNLVLHYGSFLGLLLAAASWPDTVFIDPAGSRKDASYLNEAKRSGPLVLLDPIQPDRNAAAALSIERFRMFRERAKAFLAAPEVSFFQVVPLGKEQVQKWFSDRPFLCYTLVPLDGSKDVVGTKLLKAHQFLVKTAKSCGFSVVADGFEFSGRQAFAFLVVKDEPLSVLAEHRGPPLTVAQDADRFRAAHESHEIREVAGRLVALVPRPARTLKKLFSLVVNDQYFSSRTVVAKII